MLSYNDKQSNTANDLVLSLDSTLFDNKFHKEEKGETTPFSPLKNKFVTDDQMFMQYNEALSNTMAKTILGDDYNAKGTNYRMCTDLTGTAITYDYEGEEVVIKLEREEDAYIEPILRSSLIQPEIKQSKFKLSYLFVGALILCILVTIGIIVLWLV